MGSDELAYYRERAFIERQRACDSPVRIAADIHLELACFYEKLVELEDLLTPTVRVVTIGHPSDSEDEPSSGSPLLA